MTEYVPRAEFEARLSQLQNQIDAKFAGEREERREDIAALRAMVEKLDDSASTVAVSAVEIGALARNMLEDVGRLERATQQAQNDATLAISNQAAIMEKIEAHNNIMFGDARRKDQYPTIFGELKEIKTLLEPMAQNATYARRWIEAEEAARRSRLTHIMGLFKAVRALITGNWRALFFVVVVFTLIL